MNIHGKADWIGNIVFNLLLAVILSCLAQIVNAGGIQVPGIFIDIVISFIVEMLIVMFLPLVGIGFGIASKNAQPGSTKFKVIMTTAVSIPFAILMSAIMSFISVVLMLHLPAVVWLLGLTKMIPIFIVAAWICVFLFMQPVMGWANKTFGNHE